MFNTVVSMRAISQQLKQFRRRNRHASFLFFLKYSICANNDTFTFRPQMSFHDVCSHLVLVQYGTILVWSVLVWE